MAHAHLSMPDGTPRPTTLLSEARNGHQQSAAELFKLLYGELRTLADTYLRRERANHTLQPTALVHEAWVKLIDLTGIGGHGESCRREFFSIAARAMRQILVDHARNKNRQKRTPAGGQVTLFDGPETPPIDYTMLLDLEAGMEELAKTNERLARVAELRLFGGLKIDEIAAVLEVSRGTIKVDWSMARALLSRQLGSDEQAG